MNKTPSEAMEFLDKLGNIEIDKSQRAILCMPYLCLEEAVKRAKFPVEVASQNVHHEASGAFTGEISADMLKSVGIEMSIVGHSERREYFNESDDIVNKKIRNSIKNELEVILCVGESLVQREDGTYKEHISNQIKKALNSVSKEEMTMLHIAYEPIWAIGTGKTASTLQAQEICRYIREILKEIYDANLANSISILYGGSVKPSNIKELMSMDDIDGALVGGASLEADSFLELVNYNE